MSKCETQAEVMLVAKIKHTCQKLKKILILLIPSWIKVPASYLSHKVLEILTSWNVNWLHVLCILKPGHT